MDTIGRLASMTRELMRDIDDYQPNWTKRCPTTTPPHPCYCGKRIDGTNRHCSGPSPQHSQDHHHEMMNHPPSITRPWP